MIEFTFFGELSLQINLKHKTSSYVTYCGQPPLIIDLSCCLYLLQPNKVFHTILTYSSLWTQTVRSRKPSIWGHGGAYRPFKPTDTQISFSFSVQSLIHGGPWVCCLNEDECKESICTFPTPSGSSALHHQLTHQLGNTHTHTPPTSAVCSLPLNSELPEPARTCITLRARRSKWILGCLGWPKCE